MAVFDQVQLIQDKSGTNIQRGDRRREAHKPQKQDSQGGKGEEKELTTGHCESIVGVEHRPGRSASIQQHHAFSVMEKGKLEIEQKQPCCEGRKGLVPGAELHIRISFPPIPYR